ncbi:MBL fold metallo-hydrolase [Psychrobacillus vulpis]|uniref:MBL fold metallo-hydrolase n=1 Tax=Psychrobacillus vulpis TaxID=2325572 RepID=A0A544TJ71_9BACI|nr:MBL fold metallo-hydrolase [Psychrobacillus vulpis]TQR17509.1 MBL fold metallo-hydrolase [Psychrobacillus vulpis]
MKVTTVGYWGAYPSPNGATSCYLVQEKSINILLDCGSGALAKLQNYIELEELDAVFISHTHTDHMADIYSLEYAMLIQTQLGNRKRPLDIYVYEDNFSVLPFEFPDIVHVHPIKLKESITVGPLKVSFTENLHEIPCVAMKVVNTEGKTLVYSADTGMTETIKNFGKSADIFIVECSFFEKQKGFVKGHLSTIEVAEIVNFTKPKITVLTHFPHFGETQQLIEEVRKYTTEEICLASDGFTINL